MNKRAVILSTTVVFGFFLVITRLADIMLLNHERLSKKARQQHILKKDMEIARGTIYDRKGRELAVNIETDSLYCDPKGITHANGTALKLSSLTGIEYRSLMKAMSSNKSFQWLQRKLNPETAEEIKRLNLEGIGLKTELKRFYPKGQLCSHVIGSVGIDNQPLEAVELKYDETLRKPGSTLTILRDADGRQLSEGMETSSKGNNIILTIDEGLQYIVEEELQAAMLKWRPSHAVVIMMDPYTGEILAMTNRPTYDPNYPSESALSERRNSAITDLYEPGSTFKLITAVAGLETDAVELNTRLDCSKGSIKVGKWLIQDAHRHGVLTFKEVIQMSSNVGSVMVGLKVGRDKLVSYARMFGFGEKTGIDLPGEAQGWVTETNGSDAASTATLSIGYGVAATPIQVLRAYSAIANGGILVRPYVVSEIRTPEGYLISEEKGAKKRAISKNTADMLKDILMSVTEKAGTAPEAAIEGNLVAGKTGTTKMRDSKLNSYSKERYVSSFVGFVPADNPRVAIIVVIYEPKDGYYGGIVAAPVFKAIVDKTLSYLNVPRDDIRQDNTLVVRARGIGQ